MDGLEQLFILINNEVYQPFNEIMNNSPIIQALTTGINNILIALFGHTSNITIENISAILTTTLLISLIVIVINLFITAFETFTSIRNNKRR